MRKATKGNVDFIDPNLNSKELLLKAISDSTFNEKYVLIRSKVKTDLNDGEIEFRITTKIVKDSAIQVRIKKGVPVANVLVTPDSIMVRNDLDKTIILEDYEYLEELIGYRLNFKMLQNILIGEPYYYYGNSSYTYNDDKPFHLLTTVSKRKLKKQINEEETDAIYGIEDDEPSDLLIQALWFNGIERKMTSMFVKDPISNRKFWLNYHNWLSVGKSRIPELIQVDFKLKLEKKRSVHIEHVKGEAKDAMKLSFRVPQKYEVLD